MPVSNFPFQSIDKLTFINRPHPMPASLRPIYRVALLALVLKYNCRANAASLIRLQFFNWILKSPSLRRQIDERIETDTISNIELVHMDPMVNLALKYAVAEGLIIFTKTSKYKLTPKGHDFTRKVIESPDELFRDDRELLERIGQRISEIRLKGALL